MRSDLVFGAVVQVSNRYRLCKVATEATRKLHRPNSRIPDTINDVLNHFRKTSSEAEFAEEPSGGHPVYSYRAA